MADEGNGEAVALLASLDEGAAVEAIKIFLAERPALLQELCDWAVPEHAFPSAKVVETRRYGHIKSFNLEKGYGFISSPELKQSFGKDIFLSSHQIEGRGHSFDSFPVGQYVSFSMFLNKGKLQAYDVAPVAEAGSAPQPQSVPSYGYSNVAWGAGHDAYAPPQEQAWHPADDGQQWFTGQVKSYNTEKRYGFLVCDELQGLTGKADVFVHSSQLEHVHNFEPGQVYAFTLARDPKGNPMAANLSLQGQAEMAYQPSQRHTRGALAAPEMVHQPAQRHTRGALAGPAMAYSLPPEMSYSAQPGLTGKRFVAPVKSYNSTKGFGFLVCEELAPTFGKADIFVHQSQLRNLASFQEGELFSFTVVVDAQNKPMAVELAPKGGPSAKRQRAF